MSAAHDPPAGEPGEEPEANARLCTYLAPAVDTRLRLLAAIRHRPVAKVLTAHLDRTLPTIAELTAELEGAPRHDIAS